MDKFSKEQRRKNMQAVKASGTKLENVVSKYLWQKGYRFRKNVTNLLGKPDIAIKKYKIVIFIDSCFWHKCPLHYKTPATNVDFWNEKISANADRDKEINAYYADLNWNILRIWEHELKSDKEECLLNIMKFIDRKKDNYKN